MNSDKRASIIAGILFLVALFFNIVALEIYKPMLKDAEYLSSLFYKRNLFTLGVLLDFICAPAMILIPVVLYPILKRHDERLAMGYITFRLLEGILFTYKSIITFSFIDLSQNFLSSSAEDRHFYSVIAKLLHSKVEWAVALDVVIFTIGGLFFYSVLFKSKLVPGWLSIWGIAGDFILLIGITLFIFGIFGDKTIAKSMIFFAPPIALNELILSFWLIFKGLNATTKSKTSN